MAERSAIRGHLGGASPPSGEAGQMMADIGGEALNFLGEGLAMRRSAEAFR